MLRFDGGSTADPNPVENVGDQSRLKTFLVMIIAAALLWCAAMAIHLAKAEVPTSIG